MLTREHLLAPPAETTVHVADFGGAVRIGPISAEALFRWQDLLADPATRDLPDTKSRALATIVQAGALNPDGSLMFAASEVQTVAALPFRALDAIAAAVLKLSGLDAESRDAAAKN